MIFGVLNPEKIWHQQLIQLPTSPVYCSPFTFWNPKKSFSTVLFIHTSDYLHHLRRKQTATPYPPHLKNVTTLPCKMHRFFIWLKVCCIPPNAGGCEKSWLWVGIGGSEMNRLWYVTNGMSGKQRYSKCSKWPTSGWIYASSFFRHWSTALSTTLCWNLAMSQQDASTTRPYLGLMVLDTR